MSAIGYHGQADKHKCLQFDPLKVWQEQCLREDDLCDTVPVLDNTLQSVGYHLLQVVVLLVN